MTISARRGALYICVAAAAWGTGGAAGKLLFATGGLGPVGVSFWRYLLGTAILLAFLRRTPKIFGARVLLIGAGMAVYQTAYFGAIAQSGVALATVVTMGATPVFTALGSRFFLDERLGRVGFGALAAALAGLVLLTGESAGGEAHLAGIGLALLSALGYAGVTLLSRKRTDDHRAITLGGFAVGALCLLPFALVEGVMPTLTLPSVGLLVFLAAVPTALAYGLFFQALTVVKATTASIISLGEAVGGALLGVIVFGEQLTTWAWAGCAVLLGAVVVLTLYEGANAQVDVVRQRQEAA